MAFKKWVVGNPDREIAKQLAEEFEIDPFTALIACGRGVSDSSELDLMLTDEPLLCDSRELADIEIAAEIINTAIENKEKIAVFGDYDCDGVVATAIMYDCLKKNGADVIYYIPDRINEGYGMNTLAIDTLKAQNVSLIVTVDNGISCHKEIEYANSLGIKTVVTDHHIPSETLPNAMAVVDPHRKDCPSQFKEICGAQVAFKVACVIEDVEPEQILYRYAQLLGIAILGDVMPLTNENRSIVKEAIKFIKYKPLLSIATILSVAGIDRKTLNAGRISFGIVPRINAAGRMGDAKRALELLLCEDGMRALALANEIDNENAHRQQVEKDIFADACKIIDKNGYDRDSVIVVANENWHCGVVGIVASKICEKYAKPAVVISVENNMCHGSGRSYSGFNLFDAISFASDTLERFGGHELAAGISLKQEYIDAFRKKINKYAKSNPVAVPKLKLDFRINPAGLSVDMAYAIKPLEPFGIGNPTPVFGIFGIALEKITSLSNGKHLKLLFRKGEAVFSAMMFNIDIEHFAFAIGDFLDIAVTLDVSFFREEYNLSIVIKDARISGIDEDKLFSDIEKLESFYFDNTQISEEIIPTREEIGVVYKAVCKYPLKLSRAKHIFLKNLGFAKAEIALTVLKELNLVDIKDDTYYAINGAKTDLLNSRTYQILNKQNTKRGDM